MRTRRAIYQITIQTKTGDGDRIGQRIRDAINGHRESKNARTARQHNTQKEYIRARQTKTGPRPNQFKLSTSNNRTGPADTEVDCAVDDAKCADQKLLIREENGKVFTDNNTNSNTLEDNFENSDLDLASNLSSSTEIDTEEKERIKETDKNQFNY